VAARRVLAKRRDENLIRSACDGASHVHASLVDRDAFDGMGE
jgi:hypothetical protein